MSQVKGWLSVSETCPRARPLDPVPVEIDGQQLIVLRDPLRLADEVAVSPFLYYFLAHCDGRRTLPDIKMAFARQFRHILTDEDAHRILAELDHHYLLDTERFQSYRQEVIRAYRAETIRRASHQGGAYPEEADRLRAELDSYYAYPDGPGVAPADIPRSERRLVGLIAPHISVNQGGPCFAWAYARLCESLPVETFVILGTGHAEIPGCFTATRKTFQTPLGSVEVDTDFLDRLEKHYGGDLCAEEIHHRSEHVIEFQVIFLQHALGPRTDGGTYRIVPILCSYGPEAIFDGTAGSDTAATVERFCQALRQTVAESKGTVCVISSADLAHVGWRYGDPVFLSHAQLGQLANDDNAMLAAIRSGSAAAFLENLKRDGNRRRICGFPCIYTMLCALDLQNGDLLRYGQSAMDDRNSTVSYASMVFYG